MFENVVAENKIFHIPPPPPIIGEAVTFQTTVSTDIDVDVFGAIFFYRDKGKQTYYEIEMEVLGNTWSASISSVPESSEIEYFFVFKNPGGSEVYFSKMT